MIRTAGHVAAAALSLASVLPGSRAHAHDREAGSEVAVTTCDGRPLGDATVEVRKLDVSAWVRGIASPLARPVDRAVETGSDGSARVAGLSEGAWHVSVRAHGRATLRRVVALRAGAPRELEFRLPDGSELRGSVVADGRTVPDALIVAGPVGFEGDVAEEYGRAVASATGGFVLDGLPRGPVDVLTAAPGCAPAWALRLDPRGFETVVLACAGAEPAPVPGAVARGDRRTLRGRVTTPEGVAIADALIASADDDAWTLSADDGSFRLDVTTADTTLVARAGGHDASELRVPAGSRDAVARALVVTLSPQPLATLRVLDERGRAVAGACVRLGDTEAYADRIWFHTTPAPPAPVLGFTGPDGSVALPRPESDVEVPFEVTATWHGAARGVLRPGDGSEQCVVTLPRERIVQLLVVSGDGAPVPEAWLRLEPVRETDDAPTVPAIPDDVARGPLWLGRTNAVGRGSLRGLATGVVRVVAAAPGYHEQSVEVRLDTVAEPRATIVLDTQRELTGRFVTDDGTPLRGGMCAVCPLDASWPTAPLPVVVRIDSGGRFRAAGRRTGRYEVELERWGLEPFAPAVYGPFDVPSRELRLEVRAARTIEGRLVREDGTPVAGARVTVSVKASFLPGLSADAATADDGTFRIENAPHGAVHVGMVHDRWGPTGRGRRAARWEPRDPGDGTLDLVLPRGLSISGNLVDQSDRPVAGCDITAVPVDESEWYPRTNMAHSGTDGGFELEGLSPGRYRLYDMRGFDRPGEHVGGGQRLLSGVDGIEAGTHDLRLRWRP